MSSEHEDTSSEGPASRRDGDERLARYAARLGLELPIFPGPLIAFDPAERRSPGDPIYLGGDLHAAHPGTSAGRRAGRHDRSLDAAEITLADFEHPTLETVAVEGIWCLALRGGLLESAPYLAISDSEGRRRTWILLPPALSMIGLAHLWLPAVPPLPPASGGSPGDPAATS
jgi:hypothetical protein